MFDEHEVALIVAPMAGGPSTPELVAAVTEAGACGFLAGGYLSADGLAQRIERTRQLTDKPFGVNLFVPSVPADADLTAYRMRMDPEARHYDVEAGPARWDDDDYAAKFELLVAEQIEVVSFTFGLPSRDEVQRLHAVGTEVVVTVTTPDEARLAAEVGADGLCVQGFEAGGHRSVFTDNPNLHAGGDTYGLLALLRLVAIDQETGHLPLIAAGGLVHGQDIAAVLAAGASAAQLGTAYLRADEAGTQPTQQRVLAEGNRPTAYTRAFSGRPARGLVNRFLREHSEHAPSAYPELHKMSKPIRAAAAQANDPEAMSLWAGQTYSVAGAGPAAEITERLWAQTQAALQRVSQWAR